MTNFKRGDVVLVAFPFTDLSTTKVRPALVVSTDSFHQSGVDAILVGITSQISKERTPTDFLLSLEDQQQAGLPKRSLVRLGKIVTLDRRLIRKKLGHIPDPTLIQLTRKLFQVLSYDTSTHEPPGVQEAPRVYKTAPSIERKGPRIRSKAKGKNG